MSFTMINKKKKLFPATQVSFESTLKCTLGCLHCYNVHKSGAYPTAELATADTIKLLQHVLAQVSARHFIFTGGEFLTRPDWKELVQAVKKAGVPHIQIMTNGSLIEEKDVAFMQQNGVTFVEISFLSADKHIFDKMAGAHGFSAFDNAIAATQGLVAAGIATSHIFVATKLNYKTLADTLELSYALGIQHFSFNRFNPSGAGKQHMEMLQLNPEQLKECLQICDDFAVSHPRLHISSAISIPPCIIDMSAYPHIAPTYCGVGTNTQVVLDAAGNVRMCPFSPTILGNALETPIADIYANDIAKEYIAAHPPFCNGCKELPRCKGGCKSSATNCYGSPYEESPFLHTYKTTPK